MKTGRWCATGKTTSVEGRRKSEKFKEKIKKTEKAVKSDVEWQTEIMRWDLVSTQKANKDFVRQTQGCAREKGKKYIAGLEQFENAEANIMRPAIWSEIFARGKWRRDED